MRSSFPTPTHIISTDSKHVRHSITLWPAKARKTPWRGSDLYNLILADLSTYFVLVLAWILLGFALVTLFCFNNILLL